MLSVTNLNWCSLLEGMLGRALSCFTYVVVICLATQHADLVVEVLMGDHSLEL